MGELDVGRVGVLGPEWSLAAEPASFWQPLHFQVYPCSVSLRSTVPFFPFLVSCDSGRQSKERIHFC